VHSVVKQVDVVLLLKTRHHAALLELITHAYLLNAVYYNNISNLVCNAFVNRALNDFVIKLILYFIILPAKPQDCSLFSFA